jgi:hypothetical protein
MAKGRLEKRIVRVRARRLQSSDYLWYVNESALGSGTKDAQRSCHPQTASFRFGASLSFVDQQQVGVKGAGERDCGAFTQVELVCDLLESLVSTGTTRSHSGGYDIQSRTASGVDDPVSSEATASGTTTSP